MTTPRTARHACQSLLRSSNRLAAASSSRYVAGVSARHSFSAMAKDAPAKDRHAAYVRSALSAGPLPYVRGWAWQRALLNRRLNRDRVRQQQSGIIGEVTLEDGAMDIMHPRDWLLLFEHEPVYTLGRGASEDHLTFLDKESDGGAENRRRLDRKYCGEDASRLNIDRSNRISQKMSIGEEVDLLANQCRGASPPVRAPNSIPIYRIERGGEVTYHGPGQLVVYPLLDLGHPAYRKDLHWYLRQIEEVVIRTLAEFGVSSNRDEDNTGVWVGRKKIAAVGVSSSRWITTHGLAINVRPNLEHFDKDIILPCGIKERGVTSMASVLGAEIPTMEEVADVTLKCFGDVFGIGLASGDPIK